MSVGYRRRFPSSLEPKFNLNNSSRFCSPAPPNHKVAPLSCRLSGMNSFWFSVGQSADGVKENKKGAGGNSSSPTDRKWHRVARNGRKMAEWVGNWSAVDAGLLPPLQSDFLSLLACRHTGRKRWERHPEAASLTTPSHKESTTTMNRKQQTSL